MHNRSKLLPLALLAASQCVLAQQIPGAGTQLRQLTLPVAPQTTEPRIRIEEVTAAAVPGSPSATVLVKQLEFTGTGATAPATLLAITGFVPDSQLSLRDLQAMAARITAHYRVQGYFVARAYVPAQDISDHVVTIAVSKGSYGAVTVRNHSRLDDRVVRRALKGIDSGDDITIVPLENRLLLLSDIPGVVVSSTLAPGQAPGSSDLIVDVAPGRLVTGYVDADNAGNPYTGEVRVGAAVNLNNLAGRGDVASLRVLTSGSGLRYGRAAYQMPFGPVTAGVAYSRLDYELGKQFTALGAHGTAEVASVFATMPLIRSRASNVYAGLAFERRDFNDQIDLVPSASREARADVAIASLYGNHQDAIGGGGSSSFFISLSAGSLDIRTPAALAADAVSARSNGSYSKLWFNVARSQRLSDTWSLRGSLTGQFASKNLDPSEKLVLGGMDGIRAYPQGEGFGDQGLLLDVEARVLLAGLSARVPGQVSLLGFVDVGRVTINKNPWYAGPNTRNLSGAGIGAVWEDAGNFAVRAYYSRKLGNELALSAPDESGRFWIQAIKYF